MKVNVEWPFPPRGKTCTKCKEFKLFSEFSKCGNGLRSYCHICNRAIATAWNRANPEKRLAREQHRRKIMNDSYVKGLMKCQGLPFTPELIEFKRQHLNLKRTIRSCTSTSAT